jgi:hypothetical protein
MRTKAGWRDLLTTPAPSLIYGFVVFAVSAIIVVGLFVFDLDRIFFPLLPASWS